MPSLYIGESTLQYAHPIQIANTLWYDPEWIVEELFSGYRAILKSIPESNSIFLAKKCCNGHSLGKDLTNNFFHIKDLPIFKSLGSCELDCIVVSNQKSDMEQIFDMGPLGSEKLNIAHGLFKIILLDILKFKGVILKDEPWKKRRIYLEDAHRKIGSPHVLLSEAVSGHKRMFYDALSSSGSKGVVFKNIEAPYTSGMSRNFLETKSSVRSEFRNVTIREGFKFTPVVSDQQDTESFDFDTYLVLQALDTPDNIKKLLNL